MKLGTLEITKAYLGTIELNSNNAFLGTQSLITESETVITPYDEGLIAGKRDEFNGDIGMSTNPYTGSTDADYWDSGYSNGQDYFASTFSTYFSGGWADARQETVGNLINEVQELAVSNLSDKPYEDNEVTSGVLCRAISRAYEGTPVLRHVCQSFTDGLYQTGSEFSLSTTIIPKMDRVASLYTFGESVANSQISVYFLQGWCAAYLGYQDTIKPYGDCPEGEDWSSGFNSEQSM